LTVLQSLQPERSVRSGPGEHEERFEKFRMRSDGHFARTRRNTVAREEKFPSSLHAHLHLDSVVYITLPWLSGFTEELLTFI
jgi:hypothetical protein